MRGLGKYKWVLFAVLPMLMMACRNGRGKTMDTRVTLRRTDKIPYGCFYAFESLKNMFPDAEINVNHRSPAEFGDGAGKKAYFIIVSRMNPDSLEWNGIMNFVGQGNIVFISSADYADSLLHAMSLKVTSFYFLQNPDSLKLSVYNPVGDDSFSYSYPGYSFDSHVSSMDSQYTTVLGRDAKGRPDFLKFTYKGGGMLFLHFAPLAFTNFFLLHKQNKGYYDNVLSYLPSGVGEVRWDEYFRYERRKSFSAFTYIFSVPPLRWAFWLLIGLFLILFVFGSKRLQRSVPVIQGLRNTSLDFVRTIGRLYYQRRDNHNLALKMVAHFQDHVRTQYQLATSTMDEEFLGRLSQKTSLSVPFLEDLVASIKSLQGGDHLSDRGLLYFYSKLKAFYTHG